MAGRGTTVSTRTGGWDFVGRDREVLELRDALDSLTTHRRGELFLISGEPGIGKTRLADQFATEASVRGVPVVWGRCWEGGGAPAFWPWIQVIRACLRGRDPALVARMLGPAVELATLIPELREAGATAFASEAAAPSVSREGSAQSEQARFVLFDSITNLLKSTAAEAPMALVLDDCHAADIDSLTLLRFVARELHDTPVIVIVTYREAEVRQVPQLEETFAMLGREGRHLALGGLVEEEVRRLLESASAGDANQRTVGALLHATEGNPFFLTEIIQLLRAERRQLRSSEESLTGFELPDGVRIAIRRRVGLVSEPTRRALTVASVIGRDFDHALLRIVTGCGDDELHAAMREAIASGLVVEADAVGGYRFSHILLQQTLYSDLSRLERREFHRGIAAAIENLHAQDLDAWLPELAYHATEALPLYDRTTAINYAARAARRAVQVLAYREASRRFTMAVRAIGEPPTEGLGQYCELLLELGGAQFFADEHAESKATFLKVAELARKIGSGKTLARAVLGYGALYSSAGQVDQEQIAKLNEALAAVGADDSAERAMLLARLSVELYWTASHGERERLSGEAVAIARRVGEPRTQVAALYSRYLALWDPEHLSARSAVSEEMVRLVEEHRLRESALRGHFLRIGDALETGNIEAVDRMIAAYERAVRAQTQNRTALLEMVHAMRAMIEGRFDDAERIATAAFELAHDRDPSAVTNYATQIGLIRREQGRMLELEGPTRGFLEQAPGLVFSRCALAIIYADAGRHDDALAQFEALAGDGFAIVPRDATWIPSMTFLSEVCAALGDRARAAILYEALMPYAARNAALGSLVCYGPVSHYLGILAATLTRFDDAERHFSDAIAAGIRMGAPPWIAHTNCEYGAMLLRRDAESDRARGTELLAAAIRTAESHGMIALARRANAIRAEAAPTRETASGRRLATIMFLDIVDSTPRAAEMGDQKWKKILDSYYDTIRVELSAFGGREMNTFGDDFFALFEHPLNAVRCAWSIRERVGELGLELRAGLHTGECEFSEGKVTGIAIHIGARVVRSAGPGEVMVSSTVKDVVAGARIEFEDRGAHVLKGVPGEWRLFALKSAPPAVE